MFWFLFLFFLLVGSFAFFEYDVVYFDGNRITFMQWYPYSAHERCIMCNGNRLVGLKIFGKTYTFFQNFSKLFQNLSIGTFTKIPWWELEKTEKRIVIWHRKFRLSWANQRYRTETQKICRNTIAICQYGWWCRFNQMLSSQVLYIDLHFSKLLSTVLTDTNYLITKTNTTPHNKTPQMLTHI